MADPITTLTTVGALVAIAKNLIDAIKGARGLFGNKKGKAELESIEDAFSQFQGRLQGLASQLTQSETLSRMLPVWLNNLNHIPIWKDELTDEEIPDLDRTLRNLINDSVHDSFSGTFFQQDFDSLPDVPSMISDFRIRLKDLDRDLQAIPFGGKQAWKLHWVQLKIRLGDLRSKATELEYRVADLRGELIREIESASSVTSDVAA